MPENANGLVIMDARPSRADAVKNRQLLLDTAARLFAEHGVDEVTMSAVAQAAGVGKGTLYRHFTDKAELCHALLDYDQRDLQERTLKRLRSEGNSPCEDLRWFMEEIVGFAVRNLSMLNVVEIASKSLNHAAHQWWRQTIRALLTRLPLAGDLDYVVDTLYVMVDPQTLSYQINVRGYDVTRVLRGINHLIDRLVA